MSDLFHESFPQNGDLREPLKKSIQKRLPWLIVLFVLGLLISGVVGLFEGVVAQLPLLMGFQSLILAMAGNVGTQSLAVTVRVLNSGAVKRKEKATLILKESCIALTNGLLVGALSFFSAGGYLILVKAQSVRVAISVSACIAAALTVSMLLSGVMGTVVPIFIKKIKVDPAVASGPLITTVNDLIAVVSYYGLAWLLLIRFLQI